MTPEELALLATIAGEPHNRLAGLVWCDWVEERLDLTAHNPGELDWLRRWLDAKRGDRSALVRAPAVVEALHRANCHPQHKDHFYHLKARLLAAYGEPGAIKTQDITLACWGCANCREDDDFYSAREGCDGDGVYSRKRFHLQSYTFGRTFQLGFLVPLRYHPAWAISSDEPDIVGRVPTDPTVTPEQSLRSQITLGVAAPWLRYGEYYGAYFKRSWLAMFVDNEQRFLRSAAWIQGDTPL